MRLRGAWACHFGSVAFDLVDMTLTLKIYWWCCGRGRGGGLVPVILGMPGIVSTLIYPSFAWYIYAEFQVYVVQSRENIHVPYICTYKSHFLGKKMSLKQWMVQL